MPRRGQGARRSVRVALLGVLMAGCGLAAEREPPNVVLYVVDTLRADSLGVYGHPVVETPAIDQFAREATLFESAYAPSSWTRASLASLLTGLHPDVHGVETREQVLADELDVLPELFARAGYTTGAVLTNPNVGSVFGFDQGWDDLFELYGRRERGRVGSVELTAVADDAVDRAIEWLERTERPFFLLLLTIDPHWPYTPPPGFDRYAGGYAGPVRDGARAMMRAGLTDADRERVRAFYHGEVAYTDSAFGRFVQALRRLERWDDTILALTSDHGEEFWEHGRTWHGQALFEESIRVPLIVRGPPGLPPGTRVHEPVALLDLFPTLLTLAGLTVPPGLDARPLGADGRDGDAVLYASLHLDQARSKALVSHPWKLILNQATGRAALFDLDADPGERHDVSGAHPMSVANLRHRMLDAMQVNAARRASLVRQVPASVPDDALPEETRRALEALGYVEREP